MRRRRTSTPTITAGVDAVDAPSGRRKRIDELSPSCDVVASLLPNLLGSRALPCPSRASKLFCVGVTYILSLFTLARHAHSIISLTFHNILIHNDQTHRPAKSQSIIQINKSCTSRNNRWHIHRLLLRSPPFQQHTSNTSLTTLPSLTSIQLRYHAPTIQKIHSSKNQ